MKGSGIYAIRRLDGSRQYVGSAVNIDSRWSVHRCRLGKGNHHSPHLQSAWTKHGGEAFEFIVLEEVTDRRDLIAREQAWIDALNPYYNTVKVAGSVIGHKVSAEARAKISRAHRGRVNGPPSQATRAKISKANAGRSLSAEHRAKLAAAKLGTKRGPYSAQHRARIAAGVKASWDARMIDETVNAPR